MRRFVVDITPCPWACGGEDCPRLGFTTSLRPVKLSQPSQDALNCLAPSPPVSHLSHIFWARNDVKLFVIAATVDHGLDETSFLNLNCSQNCFLLHNFCTQEPGPRNIISHQLEPRAMLSGHTRLNSFPSIINWKIIEIKNGLSVSRLSDLWRP